MGGGGRDKHSVKNEILALFNLITSINDLIKCDIDKLDICS